MKKTITIVVLSISMMISIFFVVYANLQISMVSELADRNRLLAEEAEKMAFESQRDAEAARMEVMIITAELEACMADQE